MKEKDIERRLNSISKKITPKDYNFYNKIKKEEKIMNKSFRLLAPAMALILIVLFGGLFIRNNQVTSVSIDVNPSIALDIKKNSKIDSCTSLNEDGEKILEGLKLDGIDLNTGLHAIIGSMYKNGYITEAKNSILVSVEGKNDENNIKLENDITNYINEILTGYNVSPSVLSQTVESNDSIKNQANEYNITIGKAKIINEILKTNTKRTFEDLAKLSISELNLILNDQTNSEKDKSVNVSGEANTSEYITKDKAKSIALSTAKVSESEVVKIEIEFDYDDGMMIYDVELETKKYEFEFEINAKTGDIIEQDKEVNDDYVEENKDTTTEKSDSKSNEKSTKISSSKALSIALSDAGVKESEIKDKEIEYEYESKYKAYIYEVSFETNKYEYDYDINAKTGAILNKDKETNDDYKETTQKSSTETKKETKISSSKALSIALSKANLKENQVSDKDVEYEYSSKYKAYIYEVSFETKDYEYEYDIKASDGSILNSEKEKND